MRPVDGLRLSGTLGITDAKYKRFPAVCVFPGGPAAGTPCDRSGEPFEQIPKTTWSVSGEYRHPVGGGDAAIRLDYNHVSKVASQGITYTQTPNLAPLVTQPGYGLLNGRVSWSMHDSGVEIAVWARNLTDKRYYMGFLDFVNSGLGFIEGQPAQPRTWGAELGFRF